MHRRMTTESQKARDIVASYGLDPDVHGPSLPPPIKPPPKLHKLPEVIARIQADARLKQAECEAIYKVKLAEAERDVDDARIPGFTGETLRAEIDAKHVGPPTFTAAGLLADLVKIAMECRLQNTIVDEIEDMIVDKKLHAEWKTAETNLRAAYRATAHLQDPAPALSPALSALARERVLAAVAAREDFSELNFTGADLRGIDLHGADLSSALFESVDFSGADLRGCKLEHAVLAHANLTETRLDSALLAQANLGKATLTNTTLAGADLQRAQLGGGPARRRRPAGREPHRRDPDGHAPRQGRRPQARRRGPQHDRGRPRQRQLQRGEAEGQQVPQDPPARRHVRRRRARVGDVLRGRRDRRRLHRR
jgi:uncharacterized protein YjbI with pentapeptide repeats